MTRKYIKLLCRHGRKHFSIPLSTAQSTSVSTKQIHSADCLYFSPVIYMKTIFSTSLPSLDIVRL